MIWLVIGALAALPAVAQAATTDYSDPKAVQPYIESLKEKNEIHPPISLPPPAPTSGPTQKEKSSEHSLDPQDVQPYLESLRDREGMGPSQSLSPAKADPRDEFSTDSKTVQPYIESVKGGRELEAQFRKPVRNAAGVSFVAADRFNITSDRLQANAFDSVYSPREKYNPGIDAFYERQVFRSRYLGSIGVAGHIGFISTKGKGVFSRTGTSSSDTFFQFMALPVTVAACYRLVQLRFVVPFVQLGVVGIPFIETRDDDHPSRKGISRGYNATFGVALNLDWIGRKDAWDQYDQHGIVHTYLVAQVEYLRTPGSTVRFNYDGIYAGLMFEF